MPNRPGRIGSADAGPPSVKSNPATTELAPQAMLARSTKKVPIARHRADQLRCHPLLIAIELLMASGVTSWRGYSPLTTDECGTF